MDFAAAVKTCLGKYATFRGRASRSEYWYFTLFMAISGSIAQVIDIATSGKAGVASVIYVIAMFVPSLAVIVRRLHDADRSGWWYLLIFFPVIGPVLLVVWFCRRGTPGGNRFGDDPLTSAVPGVVAGSAM